MAEGGGGLKKCVGVGKGDGGRVGGQRGQGHERDDERGGEARREGGAQPDHLAECTDICEAVFHDMASLPFEMPRCRALYSGP